MAWLITIRTNDLHGFWKLEEEYKWFEILEIKKLVTEK